MGTLASSTCSEAEVGQPAYRAEESDQHPSYVQQTKLTYEAIASAAGGPLGAVSSATADDLDRVSRA